jgi:hypothetical protein
MDDQRGGIILLAVNKQDNHLTITFISSVVGAGTFRMRQTSHLQAECLYNTKVYAGQLFTDPSQNLITSLIENQER